MMEPQQQHTLLVAAHPDDETIGAGIWMARHKRRERITIVHVTDGAARDSPDREDHAQTRRRELHAAVALAGIPPNQCLNLGFMDKEAWLHMSELVERISELIRQLRPRMIMTHPYEGGHPDHDAAAFGVAQALEGRTAHWEFTSYHAGRHGIVTGEFLGPEPTRVIRLAPGERHLKRAMFAAFPSQRHVLEMFGLDHEAFRRAPAYDFTQPPHAGELQYERWGFAGGQEWRSRALQALRQKAMV